MSCKIQVSIYENRQLRTIKIKIKVKKCKIIGVFTKNRLGLLNESHPGFLKLLPCLSLLHLRLGKVRVS